MNLTVTLPVDWLQRAHPMFSTLKDAEALQRRMLTEVLYLCQQSIGVRAVAPAPTTDATQSAMRICLYLPQALARYVAGVSSLSGMPPGATAKALVWMYATVQPEITLAGYPSAHSNPLVEAVAMIGAREARPEQASAFNAMEEAMQAEKIGIVEASTGVGKTLAAVLAACRWVERNDQSCCIAVPTLALMRQVISEYRRLASVRQSPPLRTFFGRREFVSSKSLSSILEREPDRWSKVREWASQSATASVQDEIEPRWLKFSLIAVDPEFPVDDVILADIAESDDRGYVAYKAQFSRENEDSALLLCTHAMLAQDMRHKLRAASRDEEFTLVNSGVAELIGQVRGLVGPQKVVVQDQIAQAKRQMGEVIGASESILGVLPRYRALIVDEAHSLEANFSSALSEYLALRKVLRLLATYRNLGGRVSAAALAEAGEIISAVQHGAGTKAEFSPLNSTEFGDVRDALGRLSVLLAPLSNVKPRSMTAEKALVLAELRRAGNLVNLALTKASGRAYMRLSPHRAYPQLYIGRDNVENVLQMLWNSVRGGVALSATLYLYRSTGPYAGYISGILGIPDSRRADFSPIEASWLADSILQLDVPMGERAKVLRPPSRRDGLSEDLHLDATAKWLDAVAHEIVGIHATSAGGLLVLNTSYANAQGLRDRLVERMKEVAIICAREGQSVTEQTKDFLMQSDQGSKPIWLAVGGAWTGLDVGGHEPRQGLLGKTPLPPEKDNVLTDLVIPRLPFGTNNSITHLRRILTKPSVPWDMLDAGFRFRQALGRLIRRKGLPRNRRIWVLDGRLAESDAKARMAIFWAPLARIQDRVKAVKTLSSNEAPRTNL